MSMRQFTAHLQIHPPKPPIKPPQARIRKRQKPKPKYATKVIAVQITLVKDKRNFKIGQKIVAEEILKVLKEAQQKGIRAPNRDDICRVAKIRFNKKPQYRTGVRKEFREVFDILIAEGYIKKV